MTQILILYPIGVQKSGLTKTQTHTMIHEKIIRNIFSAPYISIYNNDFPLNHDYDPLVTFKFIESTYQFSSISFFNELPNKKIK